MMWQQNVPLSSYTSLRVGGRAEFLALPRSVAELEQILDKGHSLPLTFLGAGSNLLVSDRGIEGLVIGTRNLRGVTFEEETGRVTAAAGEPLPKLAWRAAQKGWSGLEWSVGIPGTVGGMAVMNAGAQGGCAADCILEVEVLCPGVGLKRIPAAELGYGYRSSLLQGTNQIVTRVVLQLKPGQDKDKVRERTSQNFHHRHQTQPYHLPSCGSVFRNPPDRSAGWLIDRCGLKGFRIGQAQVSELHANFILNLGGARAMEIYELIESIKLQVQARWAVILEPEVKMIGEFS